MQLDLIIAGLFAAKHRMSPSPVETCPLSSNTLTELVVANIEKIRRLDLRG